MDLLLFSLGSVGFIAALVFLIISFIRKKPKKRPLIALGICFALAVTGLFMDGENYDDEMAEEEIEEEIVLAYSAKTELNSSEILFELKNHLASYMLPSRIIYKKSLPLVSSDKNKINKESVKLLGVALICLGWSLVAFYYRALFFFYFSLPFFVWIVADIFFARKLGFKETRGWSFKW